MGLGKWQGKIDWPQEVQWIQSVNSLDVLGFKVYPKFKDTLKYTWDKVFRGVQKSLFAWECRLLFTLQDRVTVAQTFALSKMWYIAQLLPLPSGIAKKIESAVSSFLFRGRHERLKLSRVATPFSQWWSRTDMCGHQGRISPPPSVPPHTLQD